MVYQVASNLTSLLLLTLENGSGSGINCGALDLCSKMESRLQNDNLMQDFLQHQCQQTETICSKSMNPTVRLISRDEDENPLAMFVTDYLNHFNARSLTILMTRMDYRANKAMLFRQIKSIQRSIQILFLEGNNNYQKVGLTIGFKTDFDVLVLSDFSLISLSKIPDMVLTFINVGRWIMKSPIHNDILTSLNLRFGSDVTLFEEQSSSFILHEVYQIQDQQPIVKELIGFWSQRRGLRMTSEFVWERRKDLGGTELSLAIVHDPPWMTAIETGNGQLEVTGPNADLWQTVASQLNVTTRYYLTPDGKYGAQVHQEGVEGCVFNGMIGEAQNGNADVLIQSLALDEDRAKAADAGIPVGYIEQRIFYKPEHHSAAVDWTTYISPFRKAVWPFVLGTLALFSIFYTFAANLNIDEAWTMLNPIVCQGYPEDPWRLSSRLVFLEAFYFGLLLWFHYNAVFTSFLTFQIEEIPFHNLETMLNKTNYRIGITEGSLTLDRFQDGDELRKRIFRERGVLYPDYDAMLRGVLTEHKLAALAFHIGNEKHLDDGSCRYRMIPAWKVKLPTAYYYRPGLPYQKAINHQLQKLVESGKARKLLKRFLEAKLPTCKNQSNLKSVSIEKTVPLLVLVAAGSVVSFILYILETLFKRIRQRLKLRHTTYHVAS